MTRKKQSQTPKPAPARHKASIIPAKKVISPFTPLAKKDVSSLTQSRRFFPTPTGAAVPNISNRIPEKLQPGSKGSNVEILQRFLVSKGFLTQAQMNTGPGIYGPQTTRAVEAYQRSTRGDSFSNRNLSIGAAPVINESAVENFSQDKMKQIEEQIIQMVEGKIESGKVINPDATIKDFEMVGFESFLEQAGRDIAPEFAQKFSTIKDSLTRSLTNIGYDLNLNRQNVVRQSDRDLLSGTEDLAGRGLAFSGARDKFGTDISELRERGLADLDTSAFRSAQEKSSVAEGFAGTDFTRGLNMPSIGGRSLEFSSTPLVGSINTEQTTARNLLSKQMATEENQRRAFARGNLAFA